MPFDPESEAAQERVECVCVLMAPLLGGQVGRGALRGFTIDACEK